MEEGGEGGHLLLAAEQGGGERRVQRLLGSVQGGQGGEQQPLGHACQRGASSLTMDKIYILQNDG